MQARWLGVGSAAILLASASIALAQPKSVDEGQKEFEIRCSACHGIEGKGNGPGSEALKVAPPDLTVLSKTNGGVFPIEKVTQVIDGRARISAHGSQDMPVWGRKFAVDAAAHYVDVPYNQEQFIRNRILVLTDYIHRIQKK